jgi:hypothetical protein
MTWFLGGLLTGVLLGRYVREPKPKACQRCPENPDNYS